MKSLILTGMTMMLGVAAFAHDANSRGYGAGQSGYGGGYGAGYSTRGVRYSPVTDAIRDLNSIWSRSRVDNHEADHFRRAIAELDAFRDRAARGHLDRGLLNRALGNMDHLASARQLHPKAREAVRRHMISLERMDAGSNGYNRR